MAWINEIYDTLYDENTICVACISYGKDSLAMLRAIKQLGLPLHRIVHTEVWATQTISADLPPMVEFKKKADKIIKELYGIEVEHICATKKNSQSVNVERERERERESYEDIFYRVLGTGKFVGNIHGFPCKIGEWCKHLKYDGKVDIRRYILSEIQGRKEGSVYGFATHRNIYCRGELKNIRFPNAKRELVPIKSQANLTDFQYQSAGDNGVSNSNSFLIAPRMRGAKQISFSILVLHPTSL